jgi:hypothetical protein
MAAIATWEPKNEEGAWQKGASMYEPADSGLVFAFMDEGAVKHGSGPSNGHSARQPCRLRGLRPTYGSVPMTAS